MRRITFLTIIILLTSCVTFEERVNKLIDKKFYSNNLQIIMDQARSMIGLKPYEKYVVRDKVFILDCIGAVSAIFYADGIDISKFFYKYKGSGVDRFYWTLLDYKTLHKNKIPESGDVIFWDNTWDANEDGVFGNDFLTHVGLVMNVEEDGTIHYIHVNYVKGIIVERMNLNYPSVFKDKNGKELNSPMFLNSQLVSNPPKWLSGDLFKEFGGVLKLKDILAIK